MVVGVVGAVYRCCDAEEQKDGVHPSNLRYAVTKDLCFLEGSELEEEFVYGIKKELSSP
jgi:hypothetical protein